MGDEGDDPFDSFDDPGDAEDDPFAHLDDPQSDGSESSAAPTDGEAASDPGESLFDDVDRGDASPATGAGGPRTETDSADPFGDLRDREGDPFEEMDGADADADEVWDRLAEGDDGADPGRATAVVDKSRFCEQCPHFSRPPAAHCTNDGTSIVEFVGMDEVRVTACPVVAERQALEDISDIHVDPEE